MLTPILLTLIIGIVLFLLTFLIIRGVFAPKKIQYLQSLISQKRYDNAARTAKRIINKEPRNAGAHYLLGKAYMAMDNMDMALIEYRTVNNLGHFDNICVEKDFRKEMAMLFINKGQDEEALKEYLLLLRMEPNDADHYYNAGVLFEKRERSDMAKNYYLKTIGLNNRHAGAHFKYGCLLYRSKKYIEARAELEASLNVDGSNYQAHFYLGRIKKDTRDFGGALGHFENSMKDPEFKLKSIVERGACYLSMNNFEKAIIELSRAVKISTDETASETLYARFFLAHCYEKIRKIELAVEQWEKIYAKKPSFRNVAEKLSQYQELRLDDRVKDYLTSNKDNFQKICKNVIKAMKLLVREASEIPNGCQLIAVESETKWRNARKMPRLIRFYRIPEAIKDATVRSLHEEMKKLNVTRGIVFTSSSFTKVALDFAESRPIDLYNKDQLREFLIKSGNSAE